MTNPVMNVFIKSLYLFIKSSSGRGEIGKHKGLKSSNITGLVTRVTPNLFNQFNYLLDIISVAPLVKGRSDVSVS